MKPLDISNQKFGLLTAQQPTNKRKNGCIVWQFQCECGNYVEIPASRVVNGMTKSCGCQKSVGFVNLNQASSLNNEIPTGKRFGKLTVVASIGYRDHVPGHKRKWYLCKCDCGNYVELSGNSQKTGHTVSCGCVSSKGEEAVSAILDHNNIVYLKDTVFPLLFEETGRRLRFDFIVFCEDGTTVDRFVEFDGKQHYIGMQGGFWSRSESLADIKERDKIKDGFCIRHGYTQIRIPYWKLKSLSLSDIMTEKYKVQGDD